MVDISGSAENAADTTSANTLVVDFRKLLSLDADPEKQATLRKLLVEEENKLARSREQVENSERLASKCAEQIRQGKARLERLSGTRSTLDTSKFQRSVNLMETMQELFDNFQRRLLNKYPYTVELQDTTVGVCSTLEEARRRAQQFADANPGRVVTIIDRSNGDTRVVGPES
jgi:flagellar biosynthesis GTPase FlhF